MKTLEGKIAIIYGIAVFLPITISWIVLIAGLVAWIAAELVRLLSTGKNSPENSGRDDLASITGEDGGLPVVDSTEKRKSSFSVLLKAPLSLPLAVFALVVAVSGLVNGGFSEMLHSLSTLRTLLVYLWASQLFLSDRIVKHQVFASMLIGGAIAGACGAMQQIFDINFKEYDYLQATGFVGEPMTYAGQMEVIGAIALALLLSRSYKLLPGFLCRARFFFPVALFNLAGVLFCAERSAWLGFLIASVVIAGFLSRKALLVSLVAIPLLSALLWFTVPVVKTRFQNLANDPGMQARYVVWDNAVECWKSKPFLGVGATKFPRISIPGTTPFDKPFDHAHNNLLHIGATTGILGLLAFLWLRFQALFAAIKGARTGSQLDEYEVPDGTLDRNLCLGVLGGIVSLMVAGFFEYNFGTGHVRLIHWFVLGILPPLSLRRIRG